MVCTQKGKPQVLLFFTYLSLWCSTICTYVNAENTMKPGDKLNASAKSNLCSKQGTYCMSFDQTTQSENLAYLSIFAQGKDNWLVWIANRDQPVDINSATLSLNYSGVLKIESEIGEPIILYASPTPFNNNTIVATLLDTGNFVLKDIQKNIFLWQSFDHPTDSLLPGMKLGVNRKTGENWSLVSSISDSSPASGPFRLEWEPTRNELVIKRKEKVYWTSGELMKNNRFEYIQGEDFEVEVESNEEEEYFTYTTPNEDGLTKWTLLQTGQLINSKGSNIARADLCYGYNTNGGCQKWNEVCRNPGDRFDTKPVYSNENMVYNIENANYGISDCQEMCWSNCSCFGFNNYYINGTGCVFMVSIEGLNIASSGDNLFYVLVKNTTDHKVIRTKQVSNKRIWIYIGIGTLSAFVGVFISLLAVMKLKHVLRDRERMRMQIEDLEGSRRYSDGDDLEGNLSNGDDLKVLSYSSIILATNGFSSENKLGQGGFGPVFKGILPSGQEVAVKKLSQTSGQGITEFKNELTLISKLQHTNLVRLIGHCIHERERMLIYEYMPNKSLDFFLFDSTRRKLLDWNKRFSIIEGIAQGLLYLHKYSRLRIIHRDLKASNILLDENMNPKISDFGVARMFTKQETEANTNRIVGTYGYMSPEYAMEGVFSTKSDVYSFGVLLLEIISGQKNNSFYSEDRPLNLVGHVWELWKEGATLRLVDPLLNESFSEDEVLRCVHAGLLCVEENADDRPTMSNVISMLTNKIKVDVLPKKPAYYGGTRVFEEETYGGEVGVDSTYENSHSHVQNIDSSSEEITKLIE